MRDPSILTYVMVDDIDVTLGGISKAGGQIVASRTSLGGNMAYATFRDPVGKCSGSIQE